MESKGTTVVALCIHQALTDSYRYTTLRDTTHEMVVKREKAALDELRIILLTGWYPASQYPAKFLNSTTESLMSSLP